MSGLPEPLAPLLEHPLRRAVLAAARGIPCLLVGGAIRDLWLLGRLTADWDLVVDSPGEVAGRLADELRGRAIRLGGSRFELHRVVSKAGTLDLQAPLEPTFEGELRRRDLTINAVAVDLGTGRLDDPLDGLGDLDARLLRRCSPTSFADDPLRTLRLLRFATGLPGFEVEGETLETARDAVTGLEAVAAERVREELHKVFSQRTELDADAGRLAGSIGLFPWLWSPGGRLGTRQGPALAELDRLLTRAEKITGEAVEADGLEALHHAALLLSLGAEPSPTSANLVRRGWLPKRSGRRVDRLLQPLDEPHSQAGRRRWLARFGDSWLSAAALAWWREQGDANWPATLESLAAVVDQSGDSLWTGRAPLGGRELQSLFGLDEGPELGRLLDALRQAWIDGDVDSRDDATAWAAKWLGQSGAAGDGPG